MASGRIEDLEDIILDRIRSGINRKLVVKYVGNTTKAKDVPKTLAPYFCAEHGRRAHHTTKECNQRKKKLAAKANDQLKN